MPVEPSHEMYCPRCDKKFDSLVSDNATLELVKKHVAGQHPDHDPEWFETYPETFAN